MLQPQRVAFDAVESGFNVDRECHIKYRNECVLRPDRYCARLDFYLPEITNVLVVVECDELQHDSYVLPCELTRMEQVHEAIISAETTNGQPLLFVRYNPNGVYTVDGVRHKTPRVQREKVLLQFLALVKSGEWAPDLGLLNIVYLFYDEDHHGMPIICQDPDYSFQMMGCVRTLSIQPPPENGDTS
jgi:hypothetical protein